METKDNTNVDQIQVQSLQFAASRMESVICYPELILIKHNYLLLQQRALNLTTVTFKQKFCSF